MRKLIKILLFIIITLFLLLTSTSALAHDLNSDIVTDYNSSTTLENEHNLYCDLTENQYKIHVAYAFTNTNKFNSLQNQLENVIKKTDFILNYNANKQNYTAKFIFNLNSNCNINWEIFENFDTKKVKDFVQEDKKYLIFVDTDKHCGYYIGPFNDKVGVDDKPGYSYVFNKCYTPYVVLHELIHMLGAVNITAPNSNKSFHCNDSASDIMCYKTGVICTHLTDDYLNAFSYVVDCNKDDYFTFTQSEYLSNHWNIANSNFLYTQQNYTYSFPLILFDFN